MDYIQKNFVALTSKNKTTRQEAELSLIAMENKGELPTKLLATYLIENETRLAVQIYLIEAIFRSKNNNDDKNLDIGFTEIQSIANQSEEILLLLSFLDCCISLENPYFIDFIINKLFPKKKLNIFNKQKSKTKSTQLLWFRELIIPSLKYFYKVGCEKHRNKINILLKHEDPVVRLNSLMIFYKHNYKINKGILKTIFENDENEQIKEIAKIYYDRLNTAKQN